METTIFLAKVMGLFGAISTFAIILNYKKFVEVEVSAVKDQLFIYSSGFFILMLGVVLVVSHPVWTKDWPVIITILSWSILAKGMIRILFPETVKKLIQKKQLHRRFLLSEIAVLFISLYLIYQGFLIH